MNKIQHKFRVVSNKKLCPRFFCLALEAPALVNKIQPGQFIHIRVNDGLEPFFRRPFSVYRAKKHVEIFYEPVGLGTRALALKKPGDELDVLGPLGNHFSLPPAGTKQVVMIAGGIGIAPFLILSDHLVRLQHSSVKESDVRKGDTSPLRRSEASVSFSENIVAGALAKKGFELVLLYGGRTAGHVYPMKEFKQNGCRIYVTTDDGSVGTKGRVSKLFSKINPNPKTTMLYTCGPKPMLAAVKGFALEHHLCAEGSCEEVMACALGACLGCSIETTSGYKTVCYDGPVFDVREVVF